MKIIASDYDGTFNHNGIDENKRISVARWRKAGNLFGIISGRGYPSLKEVVDSNPFEYDFLICNNGAVIYDHDEKIVFETRCNGSYAKPLIKNMFKWGCPAANIDRDIPFKVINDNVDSAKKGEYTFETMPEITFFNQISTYLDTVDNTTEVVNKIEAKYSDILTPLQNGTCIDIVPKGVTKAQGIYSLLKIVGATYDDVIAVGDNINDTHMITEFRSYAMENAVESIKALADYIVSDVTDIINTEM